jgi:hypothetical protein
MPPGIAARIGTGVHKGAEIFNRAKVRGDIEPKSVVVDAAVDGYKKSCLRGVHFSPQEKTTAKTQLAEGVDLAATLGGLFYDSLAPTLDPVAVEETIILAEPGLPLPLEGTIDWREADPKKWADLKTAAKKWNQNEADTAIQPVLYPRLVASVTGVVPTELRYEILTKTKTPEHQTITTRRTEDDWRLLKGRINFMWAQLQAGMFPPADPSHWGCSPKWCGYFFTCKHIPAWRKVLPKKGEA